MESNLNSTDNVQGITDKTEKLISTQYLNYLYPNGHRMTHQMRWFKGSYERGLSSEIVA